VRDAEVVKDTIVSILAFRAAHPELDYDSAFQDVGHDAFLVELFERMSAPDALKVFVSVGSYYIGEGPHEIFDCLMLEKGADVLPFLLAANANECVQRFGKTVMPHRALVCLNAKEWKDWRDQTIENIHKNQKCSLRDLDGG